MKDKLIPVENQQNIAADIIRRCIEISNKTPHDVFFDYYPHVDKFEIHVHRGGWKSCIDDEGNYIADVENPAEYYQVNFNKKYYNISQQIKNMKAVLAELEKDIK